MKYVEIYNVIRQNGGFKADLVKLCDELCTIEGIDSSEFTGQFTQVKYVVRNIV